MSALDPLRRSAFRRLVAGRAVDQVGNAMAPAALAFAVLDLTGSTSDLGLVVGARTLANVVLLLFGGVLADRLPRQFVLVGSSAASFVTQGVVAALVLTHNATIPLLLLLSLANGAFSALDMPASSALLPQTVDRSMLRTANTINRFSSNAAQIVGATAGGVLVGVVGPGCAIAVDALSFAVAGTLLGAVRVPRIVRDGPATSTWHDLRTGWSAFTAQSWIWIVVLAFTFINAAFGASIAVLGPQVADRSIGRPGWGLVLAAATVGMLLGGLVALRLRVRRLLLLGMICTAPIALLPLSLTVPRLWLMIPAMLVAGATLEQFGVAWEVSLQEHVDPGKLARVYSYDALGSLLAVPVGEVAIGPIAQAVGLTPTLLGSAAVIVVFSLAAVAAPSVRRLVHDPQAAHPESPTVPGEPAGA